MEGAIEWISTRGATAARPDAAGDTPAIAATTTAGIHLRRLILRAAAGADELREVPRGELPQYRMVGEVELDGGDGDASVLDGEDVAAGLQLVFRLVAAKPVVRSPAGIDAPVHFAGIAPH